MNAYGAPTAGTFRAENGAGTVISSGYRSIHVSGRRALEHVAIAERALGKRLPRTARVHHVDGDRLNNAPTNLVICPNDAYHALLHRRQEAMDVAGNPNYRKCQFCKTWDSPENLRLVSLGGYHTKCKNDYQSARRSKA
ncbi:HNH endonuclease [Aromatoleum anaerobium]|uniref:HNH nuclease domain-containing protein n=1 Tax=Aromatoleum anaerobium TaxID=182180 RepID=A0ABX1PMN4_9RHOO|nr:HNH endonuclease [Aromatoleum anaerobium]